MERKTTVSKQDLVNACACPSGIEEFVRLFGEEPVPLKQSSVDTREKEIFVYRHSAWLMENLLGKQLDSSHTPDFDQDGVCLGCMDIVRKALEE